MDEAYKETRILHFQLDCDYAKEMLLDLPRPTKASINMMKKFALQLLSNLKSDYGFALDGVTEENISEEIDTIQVVVKRKRRKLSKDELAMLITECYDSLGKFVLKLDKVKEDNIRLSQTAILGLRKFENAFVDLYKTTERSEFTEAHLYKLNAIAKIMDDIEEKIALE